MNDTIKLQVTSGKAGSYPVFLGSASLRVLHNISYVDQFTMDTEEGIQRPLDKKHAVEFRGYIEGALNDMAKRTAPPLIFSLRVPVKMDGKDLVVPRKEGSMARVDCQHRMALTGDLDVPLPFVIYHGLTRDEEIEIFTTINDKHKGLTKSLVDSHRLTLSGSPEQEKPHIAIAVKLNKDPNSPWYQAVNTGGISNSTPGTKRKITLRTFQMAVQVLISGPRCQNSDYEHKYQAVNNYWQGVATVFGDAWVNHRKSLLTKGVGIAALADLGRFVIEECLAKNDTSVAAMAEYLTKLQGLDWGNKTSPFAYIGGRKGATAAARALEAVVFGNKEVGDISELVMPSIQP